MILLMLALGGTLGTRPTVPDTRCTTVVSTLDVNECLRQQSLAAERRMQRYLAAARKRAGHDVNDVPRPAQLRTFDAAHRVWLTYRAASCDAVYGYWQPGTIRLAMRYSCDLRLTKLRTHSLWDDWLAQPGETPLLPEPVVEIVR